MTVSFSAWCAAAAARIENRLSTLLPPADLEPARLHEAMRYAVLGGGKRVRPLLVYAAGELSDAPAAALDLGACAVEMIHAYSLVHDDLPCMDDDVLRRGRPTAHVVFGEALAMLAGDALQALAFEALCELPSCGVDATSAIEIGADLSRAAGSRGMAGGQAIDLSAVGCALDAAALERMHRMKTGALLAASVRIGVRCGHPLAAGQRPAVDVYCDAVGLAFQVVDDILDVEADTETLGKTAGKDSEQNKPTYVTMLGLAEAKALAARLREQAHDALAPFGTPAGRLRELADLIVLRNS